MRLFTDILNTKINANHHWLSFEVLRKIEQKKRELKVDDKTEMLICCMSFKTISDANQSPLLF